jgi:hypothetical protein
MGWRDSIKAVGGSGGWKSTIKTAEPGSGSAESSQKAKEPMSIFEGMLKSGLPGIGEALQSQGEYLARTGKPVAGTPPVALPVTQAPSLLLKAVQALGASAPRRIATNTGVGAIQGAVQDPGPDGSRAVNALKSGGSALAASILGEGVAAAAPTVIGRFAKKIDSDQAKQYIKDPKLADELYSTFQNDPEGLNAALRQRLRSAKVGEDSIYKKVSEPLIQKRGAILAGKTLEIAPENFIGTAAEPEIRRIAAAMGHTGEVLPQSVSVTGPQAQRLKEILQDAADFSEKQYAIGLAPKSPANAEGASAMRKGLEAVAPGVSPINEELQRHATMGKAVNSLLSNNPSRILSNSESIGNTRIRGVQQYLDENAGTQFMKLADAFDAGKAVSGAGPLDRLMLKAAAMNSPVARAVAAQSLSGAVVPKDTSEPAVTEEMLNEPKILQRYKENPGLIQTVNDPRLRELILQKLGAGSSTAIKRRVSSQ